MEERRRYKRLDTEGVVIIKPQDGTARIINADLISVSFVGITTVCTQENVKQGTYVNLELICKLWNEPLICKGKIIHVEKEEKSDSNLFRMGIEFVDIDKKSIQNILNIIQSNILRRTRKIYSKIKPPRTKQDWL